MRVIDAQTGKTVATARLGNVLAGLVASNSTVTAVTASPLTPASVLVLIRRDGAAGDPILPHLALSVFLPAPAS